MYKKKCIKKRLRQAKPFNKV